MRVERDTSRSLPQGKPRLLQDLSELTSKTSKDGDCPTLLLDRPHGEELSPYCWPEPLA